MLQAGSELEDDRRVKVSNGWRRLFLKQIGNLANDELKRLMVPVNLLDFDRVPPIVGEDAQERFEELYALMVNLQKPLYFTGPPGAGKSTFAENLAKRYCKENDVKCFIVQVSPESTKGQLAIGKQLRNGTLVTVRGCLAVAAEEGAVVIIDEAQQASQELLATQQSLFERNSNLSDGSEIVYAKDSFRTIFCSNSSLESAANVPVPHAFGSRVVAIRFDYPTFNEEIEITKAIIQDPSFMKPNSLVVPDSVMRYLVGLMRKHRSGAFPLSARNAAACVAYLNILAHHNGFNKSVKQVELVRNLADAFRVELGMAGNQNLETQLSGIYEFIHDKPPASTVKLTEDKRVREFLSFFCAYGSRKFVEAIRATYMVDLDIDTSLADIEPQKQKLLAAIPAKPA
jgi:MoxR-like ATPase